MKRDISAQRFESLSNEGKKKYIVNLLIKDAGAKPVDAGASPVAFVMAGIPGAGKTEFLDSLTDIMKANNIGEFVRIDLDQIVTIYPNYTPKTYVKFRSQGTNVLARCIDVLRKQRYNIMIDGTFSGSSGSSVTNVQKLLDDGYIVFMMYMYDKPETAWHYTQTRELETQRGIELDGFIQSCENITNNVKKAAELFKSNPLFKLTIVKQKELRGKSYDLLSDDEEIDKLLREGYNIDNIKELL